MTTQIPPPPTYADPVMVDPTTKKGRFNPLWLRWFLDIASYLSKGGAAGAGLGTVTSVALTAPGDFSIAGSPITGAGTLAITRSPQAKNLVLATPASSTGTPAYRTLVREDVPDIGPLTTASPGQLLDSTAYVTVTIAGVSHKLAVLQ